MPAGAALGPVRYTPELVSYVVVVTAGAVALLTLFMHRPADVATLVLGGTAIFLMARFAVRTLPVQTTWSPGVFLHLGLSLVLGPPGVAVAAVAEAAGIGLRTRNGWFRTAFNFSTFVLADLAAIGAFSALQSALGGGIAAQVAGGLAAGVSQYVVNHLLLAAVVKIASPSVSALTLVRNAVSVLPYSVGYGIAAPSPSWSCSGRPVRSVSPRSSYRSFCCGEAFSSSSRGAWTHTKSSGRHIRRSAGAAAEGRRCI